jgi:hypothetical protein
MAVIFSQQNETYLIGTSSTNATLTASYDDNYKDLNVEGVGQLICYIEYVPAQDGRYIEIQYEFGNDLNDLYKSTTQYPATTNRNLYITPTKFIGISGGTTYKLRDAIDVADKWFRISVKESGSSDFGTILIRSIATYNL